MSVHIISIIFNVASVQTGCNPNPFDVGEDQNELSYEFKCLNNSVMNISLEIWRFLIELDM